MKNRSEERIRQYIKLGLTIAYYRKLKGLTQKDLAEKINLSRQYISNLELPSKVIVIPLEKLFDIADVLEVSVYKLFDFRD